MLEFIFNCNHASTKPHNFVLKIVNIKFDKKLLDFATLTHVAIEREDSGDCYRSHDASKIKQEVVGPN